MRPVSEATSRISGKSFSKKYIALGRIVSHWNDIVGKDLASKAQPAKLRYHKHKNDKTPQATLEIATTNAHAMTLHYQKDLLLERMNRIFGERWITAIRFVSIPANTKESDVKRPLPPLSENEKADLDALVATIEDADIKLKLEKLGEAVIRKSN